MQDFNRQYGNLDLYLLDQILKGRYVNYNSVFDAGCGEGRNLTYFVNKGCEIYACDNNPMAIKMAQMTYKSIPKNNFIVSSIEDIHLPKKQFDLVICAAVLHFALDQKHFELMLKNLVDLLKSGGQLFIRMATDIGLDSSSSSPFPYILPKNLIPSLLEKYGLQFIEPWKSVVVNDERSMGVFILSKI